MTSLIFMMKHFQQNKAKQTLCCPLCDVWRLETKVDVVVFINACDFC